ncbi:hypothetical protein Gasu2_33910 [Galdieria sulphuraria]|nr:hypothetical protein Gasu2_33910 [Galdieria sulphuraria]
MEKEEEEEEKKKKEEEEEEGLTGGSPPSVKAEEFGSMFPALANDPEVMNFATKVLKQCKSDNLQESLQTVSKMLAEDPKVMQSIVSKVPEMIGSLSALLGQQQQQQQQQSSSAGAAGGKKRRVNIKKPPKRI